MSQQIEIEFKNFLTKAHYEQLLVEFNVTESQIHRQINHYFDTPDSHLKNLASGLRIRIFSHAIECTLKEKSSTHQHLETTDSLTREQADEMLAGKSLPAPEVSKRLQHLHVPSESLQVFGTLTTDRVELPYKGGTLVFDHSFYLQCDDYEVEYETNDETLGKNVFEQFLTEFAISPQQTPKKIARFMAALQGQKG
ncbi:CYTH domain-containing protein [Solibacillus sp. FSL H8-0538]|uniref:CYTH domain-containing protein n=1 Tax=Solibacillus sp. FSL H8-0538 TaxID=2921400 RepID=UPI0030F9B27F